MGRTNIFTNKITSASSASTGFSRREEKATEQFIASNPEVASLVSANPSLVPILAAAVSSRVEDLLLIPDRIVPGRRPPIQTGGGIVFPPELILQPGEPSQPVTGQPAQPVLQIDLEIQLLLNKIPIAREGSVVSSEYHNTVRDALLAIANRLGLTVKAVSDLQTLNFAPNFQQVENTAGWTVSFNKAVIPQVPDAASSVVKGSFPVQLPDDAEINSMIVRGARVTADKEKSRPKTFTISLNRQKFDTENPQITPLIVFDLAERKEKIKEANDVKESLPDDLDQATARSRTLDLTRVNNQLYQYFIEASWEGDNSLAKFEIYSLQIFCEI